NFVPNSLQPLCDRGSVVSCGNRHGIRPETIWPRERSISVPFEIEDLRPQHRTCVEFATYFIGDGPQIFPDNNDFIPNALQREQRCQRLGRVPNITAVRRTRALWYPELTPEPHHMINSEHPHMLHGRVNDRPDCTDPAVRNAVRVNGGKPPVLTGERERVRRRADCRGLYEEVAVVPAV